ncbi:MAG: archaetidylserine decarboxylase [Opitutaceae bacterium]|jgi:phosphatidylserine decarboxylase|nr:archaetidylserine decarboxylase [Opitutaceae bacterium]
MAQEPIIFFNRRTGRVETERIYGEAWLRFIYGGNPFARLSLFAVVRRAWFSAWYGWRMNRRASAAKVLPFVVDYGLDAEEFAKPATAYRTFNEFFYRRLKSEARPIAPGDEVAVFPADGRHLAYPNVDTADGFYAKGKKFTLAALLGGEELGAEFAGGSMLISRLCPVDYHRFHFPVAGTPTDAAQINGWLYSVSPLALRLNPGYLTENKRMVTLVDSPRFGRVAVLEVGATMVGAILQSFTPGAAVAKGELKGMFAFGGSCVITVFAKGRIQFDPDLIEHGAQQREVYARMGERMGVAVAKP